MVALSQLHASESQLLGCLPRESVPVLWMVELVVARLVEKMAERPGSNFLLTVEKVEACSLPVVETLGLNCLLLVSWILRKLCSCCIRRAPDWQPQ